MAKVGFEHARRGNYVMLIFITRTWSGADPAEAKRNGPVYYITIYAAVGLSQFKSKLFLTHVTGYNIR